MLGLKPLHQMDELPEIGEMWNSPDHAKFTSSDWRNKCP